MAQPASAIIPTADRPRPLLRTLRSLARQDHAPAEVWVIDASRGRTTRRVCTVEAPSLPFALHWRQAGRRSAAAQRNQGVALARHPRILFCDDDIILRPGCLARLHAALDERPRLGGVNAMIENQKFHPPGRFYRLLLRLIGAGEGMSFAGRCVGPGINFLPEDSARLPEVVPVDWINTTCVLYRREALPDPPFPAFFDGYSLCEDLALSLTVGRSWELANCRRAVIRHDSQPGRHKANPEMLARMEVVHRAYIMRRVLGRRGATAWCQFLLWQLFNSLAVVRADKRPARRLAAEIVGKTRGFSHLAFRGVGV